MIDAYFFFVFFFSSRRRHTRSKRDWSSDVCSSDLSLLELEAAIEHGLELVQARRGRQGLERGGHRGRDRLAEARRVGLDAQQQVRSEERRVGKEGRWRGGREAEKKKRGEVQTEALN